MATRSPLWDDRCRLWLDARYPAPDITVSTSQIPIAPALWLTFSSSSRNSPANADSSLDSASVASRSWGRARADISACESRERVQSTVRNPLGRGCRHRVPRKSVTSLCHGDRPRTIGFADSEFKKWSGDGTLFELPTQTRRRGTRPSEDSQDRVLRRCRGRERQFALPERGACLIRSADKSSG